MKEALLFFIQGIPEMTGIIALSFAIARVRINWTQVFLAGAGFAVLSYTIQSLSFFFGFHTFLMMFLTMIFVFRVGQISIFNSFFATSISTICLVLLEFLISTLYFWLSGNNPQEIVSNKIIWTILGMPQAIIIILISIIVATIMKPVKKGSE